MNALFQSPVTWMVLIIVALLVSILVSRSRASSARYFKDRLRNTKLWHRVNGEQDESENAAKNWDAEKIVSETTNYLLNEKSAVMVRFQLQSLGEKTHPTILRLLRDPSLYTRLVKYNERKDPCDSPFSRACDLMENAINSDWVETLALFRKDSDKGIRADAIFAIARTGHNTIAPYMREAFADVDACYYALAGLANASDNSRLSLEMREGLFPDVLALLRAGKCTNGTCEALFLLNGPKARNYFLSEEVFTAESPVLPHALMVLAINETLVPRDSLRSLIKDLDTPDIRPSQALALGQAFRLLGRHQNEEDRHLLRARSVDEHEDIAFGASMGILASLGLDDFWTKIREKEEKSGYESLSEPQKLYNATYYCGHLFLLKASLNWYFFDPKSNRWQDALAGFRAMGCTKRAIALEEAIAKFGPDGPSTDGQIRREQLAEITNTNKALFKDQDHSFSESEDDYNVCAMRFVARNSEYFA